MGGDFGDGCDFGDFGDECDFVALRDGCDFRRWLLVVALTLLACGDRYPPNVVIIGVDTLRADRVGAYGYNRPTTPSIDAVAEQGALFEQAFSAAPRTWQSFTSILTGLYPIHHGVRRLADHPLSESLPNLGMILAARGYTTAAFDIDRATRAMTGGHVFETYYDPTHFESDARIPDWEIARYFARWVAEQRGAGKPFFAFVRILGPHWPYQAKPKFHDLFGSDEGIDHAFNQGDYGVRFVGGRTKLVDPEARRKLLFDVDLPPDVMAHMSDHYDAAVLTADELVGEMVEALEQIALLDATLLVILSDHGESLGENGYLKHGPRVDDVVMRVPMILRFPAGFEHGERGQRVTQLVRTVDLVPTVLETLGIPLPDGLDGVSLLPALDASQELGLDAYGEAGSEFAGLDPERELPGLEGRPRMLRDARWKAVRLPQREGVSYRLYDAGSGDEQRDLAAQHPEILAPLRRRLEALIASDVSLGREERPLSDEEIENLRALGYL